MAAPASAQRAHIATVMQVAGQGIGAPQAQAHDEIIRASMVEPDRGEPTTNRTFSSMGAGILACPAGG